MTNTNNTVTIHNSTTCPVTRLAECLSHGWWMWGYGADICPVDEGRAFVLSYPEDGEETYKVVKGAFRAALEFIAVIGMTPAELRLMAHDADRSHREQIAVDSGVVKGRVKVYSGNDTDHDIFGRSFASVGTALAHVEQTFGCDEEVSDFQLADDHAVVVFDDGRRSILTAKESC